MFALNTAVRNSITTSSISEGIEEFMEDRAGLKGIERNLYSNWVSKALCCHGPGTENAGMCTIHERKEGKYYELDQVPLPDQLLSSTPELQTSDRKFVVDIWRQDAMKRRVKERAANMNLSYWPALLWWAEDGRRVDPVCFKIAEKRKRLQILSDHSYDWGGETFHELELIF